MSSDQLGEVGDILVSLLQQIGQALILLLVNKFTIALLILSLGGQTHIQCVKEGVCILVSV